MPDEDPFHFSHDLLELLVSTLPLLCKGKVALLDFFQGCGVAAATLADLRERVTISPSSVSKYTIARTVLKRINEGGDRTLRQRREVVKRVVEFEDFALCWPDDQLKAKGLVSDVRHAVNVRDSFTRMQQAEERQREAALAERRRDAESKQRYRAGRAAIRTRLAALSGIPDARQRGIMLEGVLNDLFRLDGISVRDSFTVTNDEGHVGEQVDGLIALDGQLILVEMKWHAEPIGRDKLSSHLVRVYNRAEVQGLFVSASGFTQPAIDDAERMLTDRVMVLAELHELLMLLEDPAASLSGWLRAKIHAAKVDHRPLFRPLLQPHAD
jgi:restriction system protein